MNERVMTPIERERVLAKINEQAVRLRNAKQDESDILGRIKERHRLARSTSSQGTQCYIKEQRFANNVSYILF
jgi:hypothetical protein